MLKLLFLIFFIPLCFAESPEIISAKDYNPQKKYTKPICVVDSSGEMECKNTPSKKIVKKEELPKFNPAKNEGFILDLMFIGFGSFKGIGTNLKYQDNQFSYGGGFNVHIFEESSTINNKRKTDTSMELMPYFSMAYHLFPRWYSFSKNYKFDLNLNTKIGYNIVSEKADHRKSEPFIGVGIQASYPISQSMRVIGGIDIYQTISAKNIGIGNGLNLGLGFDF